LTALLAMNLHSEGAAVDGLLVTNNGTQLDGSVLTTSTTLTAVAHDGHNVFSLTLEGNGTWNFQLLAPIDNPSPAPGAGEDSTILDLSKFVQAVDFDGDTTPLVSGSFLVDVVDDVPSAHTASAAMAAPASATVTLAEHVDFSYGADGPGSIAFDTAHAHFTSDPTGGQLALPTAGQYTINGSTITLNPGTDFQTLAGGQHAVLDIPYTVT